MFHEIGAAILVWPAHGSQPTAAVFTSKGTFSIRLIGVTEGCVN
jgi:hypothetical protein